MMDGQCTWCGASAVMEVIGPNIAARACNDHIDTAVNFGAPESPSVRASAELRAEASKLGGLVLDPFRPLLERILRTLGTTRETS
jgi:hypothetical protein